MAYTNVERQIKQKTWAFFCGKINKLGFYVPVCACVYAFLCRLTHFSGNVLLWLQFSAADADLDRPNKFQFSIDDTFASQFFEIRSDTGELYLIYPLDRDLPYGRANFTISVRVTDEEVNPRTSFAFVFVMPLDINDNDPAFLNVPLVGAVNEFSENGKLIPFILSPNHLTQTRPMYSFLLANTCVQARFFVTTCCFRKYSTFLYL